MTDTTERTEELTLAEAMDLLGQWTEIAKRVKADYDEQEAMFLAEVAPLVEKIDAAKSEVADLRATVERLMIEQGIRTLDGDGFQAQRPKSTRLQIVNLDQALAHIADLGKLDQVQRLVTDERAVLDLAKATGGLDGIEKVEVYGFKIVPSKKS